MVLWWLHWILLVTGSILALLLNKGAYVILHLNQCPASTTTSLKVDEYARRFWLNVTNQCSLFFLCEFLCNEMVTDWQQMVIDLWFHQFITVNRCIITNRLHIISNLTPFNHKLKAHWLHLIALLSPYSCSLSSKQPFQRQWDCSFIAHSGNNFGCATCIPQFFGALCLNKGLH